MVSTSQFLLFPTFFSSVHSASLLSLLYTMKGPSFGRQEKAAFLSCMPSQAGVGPSLPP